MSKASTGLSFTTTVVETARVQDLRDRLMTAFAATEAARKPYDIAEEAWFRRRERTGREPGEDTQEHQDLERTEKAFHAALEARTSLVEQIADLPATLDDGADLKLAALLALLREGKATLTPSIGLSPPDKLAYSLARDVAIIRGAL